MIDKIFPRKLNRSKDARLQDKTEMYDALNISIDDFDGNSTGFGNTGDAGVIKPVKGNKKLNDSFVQGETGSKRVVGSVADQVNNHLYVFVFSDLASEQGVYRAEGDTLSSVYTSEHFQFAHDDFVKGDIVYRADGDIVLYFTDGRNEPRKLSLPKGVAVINNENASEAQKIDYITACPKTPMHAPTWVFLSDPLKPVNFRSVEGFQFAYQCLYFTGEESAISTYSDVAVPPAYLSQGSLSDPDLQSNNQIRVTVPKVVNEIENYTDNIEKIRLLVRIGNDGGFFTVAEKKVEDQLDDGSLLFNFYNDSVLTGVPKEDQDKLNDALPRVAKSQTIVNDRLIYGNYEEGYDTPRLKASFTTVNNTRPKDFVDLKVGIIPMISPAFKESVDAVSVTMEGDSFVPSQEGSENKVFNRRASYQFDLSDLPNELQEGSIAELSFSVEPDGNFEIYNSENSFHTFKNNGFGLSSNRPDSESVHPNCRKVHASGYSQNLGSPAVFQQNIGVESLGIKWKSTDPGVDQTFDQIKFGTSPSNPFIIPREFVKFRVKFELEQTFEGEGAVKDLITDVLKTYFSDETVDAPAGVNFFTDGLTLGEVFDGMTPLVTIDQLMNNSDGYGIISDTDPRASTVVSCFNALDYAPNTAVAPLGFFAVNRATARFALRFSDKVNNSLSGDFSRGPVFSLHVKQFIVEEAVTMIPRITRSGSRGWIYFTPQYINNFDNIENIRKVCVFDSDELPPVEDGLDDCNLFFLNDNFCPISNDDPPGLANVFDEDNIVFGHSIKVSSFLNAGSAEALPEEYLGDSEFNTTQNSFFLFQGTSLISNGAITVALSDGNTELDSDFRVAPGASVYPPAETRAFGSHDLIGFDPVGDNLRKRRCIGFLDMSEANSRPIREADPNSGETDVVYSIIDGEANIQNKDGRVNPSFWYGVYYGTQYAGRNNNQFLLSEGSTSSSPVGLVHGNFEYKSFSDSETQANIDALIPDIEVGPRSFVLTTTAVAPGALGRSFKRNCDHSFALLYYDERGRPGEPVPLGSHFVRQVANPGVASIRLDIDDSLSPPDWAHTYKVLYGGNNSISDFIQYTSAGAFVPRNSDNEKGLIYVSLNYLQENAQVSYSKAFGAVGADGDKDLYTFSEGDRLRIISYYDDDDSVQYPQVNNPYEFQVVGTVTLGNDPEENPLAVSGDEVHPAKTGQFVILKDNSEAEGFSFADVAGSLSESNISQGIYDPNNFWNKRCVFEIFRPQKKREVESRIYYEIGDSYNVVREEGNESNLLHQTTSILINQGDVYFRKMAVNMQDYDADTNSFLGLIGDGTDSLSEATSPNFRSYHLESKSFTDIFPNADVLPYGKPRVALQKAHPSISQGQIETLESSNRYLRSSSLKFSDRSNSNSNVIRYTSFNDSKLPFKDLQINDGEIFYLVNYNDSIFCLQRLKCSSIPVARNILADALGNETVISTAKVLGTEKYYAGSYGTDVPESVALADNAVYFVSVRQKQVYRFNPNSGIEVISDKGMGSFFNEMISAAENSSNGLFKMVGGFDVEQQEYILSSTTNLQSIPKPAAAPFSNVVDVTDITDPTPDFEEEVFVPVAVTELEEALDEAQDKIEELEGEVLDLTDQIDTAVATGFQIAADQLQQDIIEAQSVGFNQGFAEGQDSVEIPDITSDNQDFLEEQIEGIADAALEAGVEGVGDGFIQVVIDFFTNNDNAVIANALQESIEIVTTAEEGVSLSFQAIVDALYAGSVTEEQARELIAGLTAENQFILADLNQDGGVSTADLVAFLSQFGDDTSSKLNPYFDQDQGLGIDYGTEPLIDP